MKTNVRVYRPQGEGARDVPVELANARSAAISTATVNMRLFGIKHIAIESKNIGIKTIADVNYEDLEGNIPDGLVACKTTMVRQTADYLLQFGILDINMMPTEEEQKVLQATWDRLKQPQQPQQEDSGAVEEIRLNIDNDPSRENVLESQSENSDKEAAENA